MESNLTRRGLLGLGAGASLAACSLPSVSGQNDGVTIEGIFAHGIASGDPATDSVILWTRLTPDQDGTVELIWEMGADPDFETPTHTGQVTTSSVRDYTVKVEPTGLSPNCLLYTSPSPRD